MMMNRRLRNLQIELGVDARQTPTIVTHPQQRSLMRPVYDETKVKPKVTYGPSLGGQKTTSGMSSTRPCLKTMSERLQADLLAVPKEKLVDDRVNLKCDNDHDHDHDDDHDKCLTQTMVMNTMDLCYVPNTTPNPLNVEVKATFTQDNHVKLHLPQLSFTIPSPQPETPPGGFLYNTPDTNLPKSTWHSQRLPYAFPLHGQGGCVLYVFNDGSLVIGREEFLSLPPGQYNLNSCIETYELDAVSCPPKNYPLTNKPVDILVTGYPNDYADFFINDFYDDVCSFVYTGNPPTEVLSPVNSNFYGVVGSYKCGKLKLNPPTLLYQPPASTDASGNPVYSVCIGCTSSINPVNKKNIVNIAINRNAAILPGTYGRYSLIRSYTMDGGNTWVTDKIAFQGNPDGLPVVGGDLGGTFDAFGNFWLWYGSFTTPNYQPPIELAICVSSDGGKTFKVVGQTHLNVWLDYPRAYFGGDGLGGHALWIVDDYIALPPVAVNNILIGYIQVKGLGNYGSLAIDFIQGLGPDLLTGQGAYCQLSEIMVTPCGDIYLTPYVQILAGTGDNGNYGRTCLMKHTGGVVNYTKFSAPVDLMITNVGGNDFYMTAGGKSVPFQPNRGVYPCGARGIDYDPTCHRLWIVSNNIKPNVFTPVYDPNFVYNMSIYAMYSDDGGQTWSSEISISDTDIQDRALPSIRVNQKTGDKAFFWYDGRGFTNQANVLPYCTILP